MPLSEDEQRVLEEIERGLHEEDPRFARQVGKSSSSSRFSGSARIKLAASIFVIGLLILFAFFVSRSILVGVVAFGAMVAGIVLAAGAWGDLRSRPERKERLATTLEDWEDRIRRRYKRS